MSLRDEGERERERACLVSFFSRILQFWVGYIGPFLDFFFPPLLAGHFKQERKDLSRSLSRTTFEGSVNAKVTAW